jgi:hypothetical protein
MALACSPVPPAGPPGPNNSDGGARADGGSRTDGPPAGSGNSIACQRLKAGSFSPVTADPTWTYNDPPPAIQNMDQGYRITLPAPPKSGHIAFKVPATGEYALYTSRPVPIAVFAWDGTAVPARTIEGSITECTEVKGRETFDLRTDSQSHVIRLGPDSQAVDIVIARP